ncbi:MAG: beta-lactamase family protein, partial [Oscillospiraceae bacterium]|nr:beta-lactamase family protein [Oscillospiraceae bacterium]
MDKKILAAVAAIVMMTAVPCGAENADAAKPAAPSLQTVSENAETVSAVGSVSKVFCTVCALQLSEQGLLDIDAPVTDYVPEFTMQDERYKDITVRMLMNHSSGLEGNVFGDMIVYDEATTEYHDTFL